MIEAHEVEHRGVQIVDVQFPLHGAEAELVARALDETGLHAAAGEEAREAEAVVVAARFADAARVVLKGGGAAKLAHAHDERLFEQAALLEIGEERRGRLVNCKALAGSCPAMSP